LPSQYDKADAGVLRVTFECLIYIVSVDRDGNVMRSKTWLELGRTLTGLTDISLNFDAAVKALAAIRVQPVPFDTKPTESAPVS
jgi:hypothetical protein